MRRIFYFFSVLLAMVALTACGGGDNFRITGNIPGIGTQNLNVVYYADGAFHSSRTAAVDGKFMFDGNSRDWTTVYFFNNARALLGMVIVRNGENVDASFEQGKPEASVITGNKPSELLGAFLAANGKTLQRGTPAAINSAVAKFVEENPDNMAATVVLTNYFRADRDPKEADRLLQLIKSKARPSSLTQGWTDRLEASLDSTRLTLPPTIEFLDISDSLQPIDTRRGTLLIYSPPVDGHRVLNSDKLLNLRLTKVAMDSAKVRFYEIDRNVTDTAQWKRNVVMDKRPWKRLWHPLNTGLLPFSQGEQAIVVNEEGRVTYVGSNLAEALRHANI